MADLDKLLADLPLMDTAQIDPDNDRLYYEDASAGAGGARRINPRALVSSAVGAGSVRQFLTVQAMLDTNVAFLPDNSLLATAGYYVAGDAGNAVYLYSHDSAAIVDHGSVHAPTAGPGRFLLLHQGWFNTRQFGCKGDGTFDWVNWQAPAPVPPEPTDDFVQMQAAFNFATASGAVGRILPGIYKIGSPLLISKGWGTTLEGPNLFPYPATYSTGKQQYAMLVSSYVGANTTIGNLLTLRGALKWDGPPLGQDGDIGDYSVAAGFRNAGSQLTNIIFAARRNNTSTGPLVLMKRLARCLFRNLTFFQAPGPGLEVWAGDDSCFDRCYAYVCGRTNKTNGMVLRGPINPPPVTLPTANVPAAFGETWYPLTNGLHFRNCDWEGCDYGNMETCPSSGGGVPDQAHISAVTMFGCVGKLVTARESGYNCFNFRGLSNSQIYLQAALGESVNPAVVSPITANEIVKFDLASGVIFDIGLGLQDPPGGPGNGKITVARGITMVDCWSMHGRIDVYYGSGTITFTEDYVVKAFKGGGGIDPTQIDVRGAIHTPFLSLGKKICNVVGLTQNESSQVLLGEIIGADFNSTDDQQITIRCPRYRLRYINAEKSNMKLDVAAGGIYTGTGKNVVAGVSPVVAAAQTYGALNGTTNAKNFDLTIASPGLDVQTTNLVFSLTTPQGNPIRVATSVSHVGTTATFTSGAHGFIVGMKVLVAGATDANYNGVQTIIAPVTSSTFTYTMSGTPAVDTGASITATVTAPRERTVTLGFAPATTVPLAPPTVTASCTDHGFAPGNQIMVYGANEAPYNGTFNVQAVIDPNTFTYILTNPPSSLALTATGTIKAKLAITANVRVYGDILKE